MFCIAKKRPVLHQDVIIVNNYAAENTAHSYQKSAMLSQIAQLIVRLIKKYINNTEPFQR